MINKLNTEITSYENVLIDRLKKDFPDVFFDGNLNITALADLFEIEGKLETYGLNWPGKKEARLIASMPIQASLKNLDSSILENKPNLLIEGDNLKVLKLISKSYHNLVDMIYIDPPYNTGKDFVYKDNYVGDLKSYYRASKQVDEDGNYLVSNPKSSGRYHANWLSMMYSRLKVARNLLKDDGLLFISIDEHEITHLEMLCNEIFGEENVIQKVVWQRHAGGGNDSKYFAIDHEYILVVAKNKEQIEKLRVPLTEEDKAEYKLKDEFYDVYGPYKLKDFRRMRPDDPRPGLRYKIIAPDGTELFDEWKWEENKFNEKKYKIDFKQGKNGKWTVSYKIYLNEVEEDGETSEKEKVPRSLLTTVERNSEGKKQLKELMGAADIFNNPKPIGLLKYFLNMGSKDALIMDFFAGSGSTAQAVLELNEEDEGNRRFILVQLDEKLDKERKEHANAIKEGYKSIPEITYNRITKSIEKLKQKNADFKADFKHMKLVASQRKTSEELANIGTTIFSEQYDSLQEVWDFDSLFNEIILLNGFEITSKVQKIEIKNNAIYKIIDNKFNYKLYIFLGNEVSIEIEDYILYEINEEDILVIRDTALNDNQKMNFNDKFNLNVI